MLKGEGGLCFVKQAFAGHLLEALGYKVDVLAARVTHPGNHVIILVHDVVERGDCFLVEVGSGYPSTTVVPITHGAFEHHFQESFLEFRYIKTEGESLIRREHRGGDPETRPVLCDSLGRPGEIDGWRRYLDFFWPQNGSLEQLSQGMMDVCTLSEASPFLTSLRAVRWVNGKMIAVKDGSFLEEEDGKIKVTALKDAQEIKQKLTECFPEVDRSTIDAAIEHWVHHNIQKCGHAGHGWGFYSGHLMSPQTTPKRKVGEKTGSLDLWVRGESTTESAADFL